MTASPSCELISPEYRREQRLLHETRNDYGVASLQYAPVVSALVARLEIDTVLDYGCGKGRLVEGVAKLPHDRSFTIELYDPAVPEYADPPECAELVVCIDVLEHIEPELLENVLDDIRRLAQHYVFLTIHTGPAAKTLSDGRNAHLTQEGPAWWMPKLLARWELMEAKSIGPGFIFIGRST
jgi:2-polyprenyl-3-methyl-5-hydroxy-6-metoxy-1,4-benzoquinol methylase